MTQELYGAADAAVSQTTYSTVTIQAMNFMLTMHTDIFRNLMKEWNNFVILPI